MMKIELSHQDIAIEYDKDLSKNSTFKLQASGTLITVKSLEGLKKLVAHFKDNKLSFVVIGLGANQLIPEKPSVPYVRLMFSYDKNVFDRVSDVYDLPASITLNLLTQHATKFGLKGWEVFTGVPATLGGAIFMNAGTSLGEIGEVVKEVTILRSTGKLEVIDAPKFTYRKNHFVNHGDIIVSAKIKHLGVDPKIPSLIENYMKMRMETQPWNAKTCGCIFKNSQLKESGFPNSSTKLCRAGLYLDILGMKGLTVGEIKIGHKHANFMENTGNGSFSDVVMAIEIAKEELKLQYGIDFETEVEY